MFNSSYNSRTLFRRIHATLAKRNFPSHQKIQSVFTNVKYQYEKKIRIKKKRKIECLRINIRFTNEYVALDSRHRWTCPRWCHLSHVFLSLSLSVPFLLRIPTCKCSSTKYVGSRLANFHQENKHGAPLYLEPLPATSRSAVVTLAFRRFGCFASNIFPPSGDAGQTMN